MVECEGWKAKGKEDKAIAPEGIEQLLAYVDDFEQFAGDGQAIIRRSIDDAFAESKLRGQQNRHQVGDPDHGLAELAPGITSKSELIGVLTEASKKIVPVLIYYRRTGLYADEWRILARAFRNTISSSGRLSTPLPTGSGRRGY